jgi:dolichol-phosphate mannosyltransferase
MKVSIIIPIYYNEENLIPLYEDLKEKLYSCNEYEFELVLVNDGSKDQSFQVMKEIAAQDNRVKIYSLSRNFGSHAAVLCGLSKCTGDCAVIKAADLQEPTELVLEMVSKWREGYNVVLAERRSRDEEKSKIFFANLYYSIVRQFALPNMPKNGFDVYLIDRKVINVLTSLEENNSALTGQILWSGFKTATVEYDRLAREIGTSKWTLKKKVGLVSNTLFSFSRVPIHVVSGIGFLSFFGAIIWAIVEVIAKCMGVIEISGFTTLFIFQLLSFGITMSTLGILGSYLWRTFDASRRRPTFIIEDSNDGNND